jgi:hypothetical protein
VDVAMTLSLPDGQRSGRQPDFWDRLRFARRRNKEVAVRKEVDDLARKLEEEQRGIES